MSESAHSYQVLKSNKNGISIDILWFLIILSGLLFLISLIPLPPNDFWWHLKIGEYIYSNHSVPTTNIFAWTLPESQPYYYASWLSELLFYVLYRIGKIELITFFRNFLIGLTLVIIGIEAHRRSNSWRITAGVITFLGFMGFNNMIVRTQMWALILFALTYIVMKRYTEGIAGWHWLLVCPICMVFWVNVHGSYILGLLIPGAFLIGEVVKKIIQKEGNFLNWRQIGLLATIGISSGLATLINPRILGIVNYTINMLTNPPSQRLIEEWQPPTPQGFANIFFYVSILLFVISLAYSKYKLTPSEIILFAGFLWLAWSGQRYILWYGMIITPIWAQLIKDLPLKMPSLVPQKNWLNLIIAGVIFVPTIAVQPWFVNRIPLPKTYWKQVLRDSIAGPLIGIETPVAAVEFLQSHPGGHLFNEMGYGSYLIWEIPEQGVFIDPRVELFPYDQWMDYIHINNGINYNETLTNYGVDRILLDKKLQPDLARLLISDILWKLEYDDEYSQIWSKASFP